MGPRLFRSTAPARGRGSSRGCNRTQFRNRRTSCCVAGALGMRIRSGDKADRAKLAVIVRLLHETVEGWRIG